MERGAKPQGPAGTHRFGAYGLIISSDRPIRELRARVRRGRADVTLRWSPGRAPTMVDWFREWRTGDPGTEFRAGHVGSGDYVLEFAAGVTFALDGEGREVTCFESGTVRADVVGRLLCDQVLPLLVSRRGLGVFHGSAVVVDGSAMTFLGPSGRGKSTLAAALGQLGHPILTDDCVVVDDVGTGLAVRSGYPGVRLWQDSLARFWNGEPTTAPATLENGKARFATNGALPHAEDAVRLGPVFLLQAGDPPMVTIEDAGGASVIGEVVSCQFLLDHTDQNELRTSFAAANHLVAGTRVCRLTLPRDLDSLGDHVRSVVAAAAP